MGNLLSGATPTNPEPPFEPELHELSSFLQGLHATEIPNQTENYIIYINDLPLELLQAVFEHITLDLYPLLCLVCKKWNSVIQNDAMWKIGYDKYFGGNYAGCCSPFRSSFNYATLSYKEKCKDVLLILSSYLRQGSRFCLYAGRIPAIDILQKHPEILRFPLYCFEHHLLDIAQFAKAFAFAVLNSHLSLLNLMVATPNADFRNLTFPRFPYGSDEFSVSRTEKSRKLQGTHMDVDHLLGDSGTPWSSHRKVPQDSKDFLNSVLEKRRIKNIVAEYATCFN